MVLSAASWVVVSNLLAVLAQTVHSTPAPEARIIWKCESEINKYDNNDCEEKGNVTGCYYAERFGTYKSCAVACDGVEQYTNKEDNCNSVCKNYLSKDGNCTLVLEVDTTTTAETSTSPTTIETSNNATTPNTPVICKCDGTTTTDESRSYSSSQFNGAAAGLFFVGLVTGVIGVLVVLVVCMRCGKQGSKNSEDTEMKDMSWKSLLRKKKGKRTDTGDQ